MFCSYMNSQPNQKEKINFIEGTEIQHATWPWDTAEGVKGEKSTIMVHLHLNVVLQYCYKYLGSAKKVLVKLVD